MKSTVFITAFAIVSVSVWAATEPAKPAAAASASPATNSPPLRLTPNQPLPATVTQLTYIDREIGDPASPTVENGSPILVHYTGWLYDGSKPDGKGVQVDTSRTKIAPYSFIVGVGKVIKGWDQGVIGMHNQGKRTLIVPASLAYGERVRPNVPANSSLIFEIEILNILSRGDGAQPTVLPAQSAPAPVAAAAPLRLSPKAPLPATTSELILIDQVEGSGKTAEAGTPVSVHYTGWLYDAKQPGGKGNKFDSSVDRGQPFVFPLGGKRVIRGWDEGVAGMKVKGKRTLIIPPQFGYGERGAGGVIPPNATLIFDVELLDVNPGAK
jgi:peptidylprolyl isomerase